MKRSVERPLGAAALMGALLALLWVLEVVDQASGNALDEFGIHAREIDGLPHVFTAPFLHFGFDHLVSNSLPFFVLGVLVLLGGLARWVWSTVITALSSGLTAWLLTPANSVIAGASGVIFGWLTYLLARGIYSRDVKQILVSVAVLIFYGGVLWGVLPGQAGVSWQGHLGGAVGGVFAARLLHRRGTRKASSNSPTPARW